MKCRWEVPKMTDERNTSSGRKRAILFRLIRYLLRIDGWFLLLAIAVSVVGNLLALTGPYLSGKAIDLLEAGIGKVDLPAVFDYALLMIICYVVSAVFSYILSVLMIKISQDTVYQMRKEIFEKMAKLPVGWFDRSQTGDILSRISYDVDTINTSLSSDIVQIFSSTVTIVGSLAMMISISPKLSIIFAFTFPLSVVLIRMITSRTKPLFRARSKKLGELNGFVEEMITGQRTIKAFNREDNTIDRLYSFNREATEAYYKSEYYGRIVGPIVGFINNLALSLVGVFGALLYLAGSLTVGGISSFVLYSRKFAGLVNEIANIIGDLQSAISAAERVFRLFDEPGEKEDSITAKELTEVCGNVELKNINFSYVEDVEVIKDLSLNVKAGSLVAIVGPTGAGKTTIINLLMRFYDPQSGTILLDGEPITNITRSSLRRAYSMVLQDTWLFGGTIYENISYGKEGATKEDVANACREAGIAQFVEQLPNGYDTVLDDDGSNISKGQKQLLTIARAILIDAKLLILDEATSNVDTRTERRIQQAMRRIMADKTCFVIAHRLSTIQNADVILVVRDGNIVETGTHTELMQKRGFYREMFEAQF
ncbi:MAG: ABC transporter ATP-binding protein, partial [Oscillospiraceae bacterium]|nr:ABC transporter ATP-binding protein [Oscillospiraceae bacterium]